MNAMPKNNLPPAAKSRPSENSRSRILIPALVFFLAGTALSAVWFSVKGANHAAEISSDAQNPATLSDATKEVLQHLDAPVEIRFYSMLDASSVADSVQSYASRADQLLALYEQVAGHKLKVIRCTSSGNAGGKAAEADGITPFNIDRGEACFLGLAVVCGSQKESLPCLAPEWEQALESDLTRAITRATTRAADAKRGAPPATRIAPATLVEVRRAIPNLENVSLKDGAKTLRDAALVRFQQASLEMQAQVTEAEQRYIEAGKESEAAQQAAGEQLRKIKAEATGKLKHIALDSHAQVAALQQLKKATP